MANHKRTFDRTRELWETRAAESNVIPSPSPKPVKRFASDRFNPKSTVFHSTEIGFGASQSGGQTLSSAPQVHEVGHSSCDKSETETTGSCTMLDPDELGFTHISQDQDPGGAEPEISITNQDLVEEEGESLEEDLSGEYPEVTDDESINELDERNEQLLVKDAAKTYVFEEAEFLSSLEIPLNSRGSCNSAGVSPHKVVSPLKEDTFPSCSSPNEVLPSSPKSDIKHTRSPVTASPTKERHSDVSTCSHNSCGRPSLNSFAGSVEAGSMGSISPRISCSPVKGLLLCVPALIFDERPPEATDKSLSDPYIAKIQKNISDLKAEADYQQDVVAQIRRQVKATAPSPHSQMLEPRAEAERTIVVASRKRKGCLAHADALSVALVDFQKGIENQELVNSRYIARLTLQGMELTMSSDFIENLKDDNSADFFVFIVFMLHEQVFATEIQRFDEFQANGTMIIGNMIQFQLINNFQIEIEALLMRIPKPEAEYDQRKHTPGFLKKLMAVFPKSGSKTDSASRPLTFHSGDQTNVMSLGSMRLTLDNYQLKRHILSEGLLVQQYKVCIDIETRLDLDITARCSGFLTFHCYNDAGTDWIRRWCVLEGSLLMVWRYPDDIEKRVSPLAKFDLKNCFNDSLHKTNPQQCARPCTFVLNTDCAIFANPKAHQQISAQFEYFVAADGKEELTVWLRKMNDALKTLHEWRLAVHSQAA